MSDPVSHLKRELLAAAERKQGHAVTARKSGRGWFERSDVHQGHRRRRLVVVAASVLAVVIGTASAIGSVRDLILDRGFVGLPPVGATPSTPDSGELVAFWMGRAAGTRAIDVNAWVYADGRIIWDRRPHGPWPGPAPEREIPEGANEFTSGYLEQRLTPEGVELVRAAVAELLDRSRTLVDTIPALDDPWSGDHQFRSALFVPSDDWVVVAAPKGDRLARLWAVEIGVKDHLDFEGTLATPEQLSALRRVVALLNDPASVLPPSAWAVRKPRAYVPSHYAVCIEALQPRDASDLFSLLPAQAADLLRDSSRTRSERDLQWYSDTENGGVYVTSRAVTDCYKVETEQTREVAEALSGLESAPGSGTVWLAYSVVKGEEADPRDEVTIFFEPYFPDGRIPQSRPKG